MAHGPHDHVHRLIRGMSRAEKRYFKLYVARHIGGQGNYRALFDAIAAMPEYDEAVLLAKFPDAGFLKRFTIAKRRLYETVLASLHLFHAESSVDARLHRSLHHVEILYQRALYIDAERMLRSVRELARKHDRQTVLMAVLEWDRRLMERTNYEGVQEQDLQALAAEVSGLRTEMDELDELWRLKSRSFILLYRLGRARSDERADELRALLEHPLLQEGAELRTVKARYLRHHIRSAVAFALNDLLDCEKHLNANETLIQANAEHFREEPQVLLGVMSNQAYVRMRLGHYSEAMEGLKQFKRLPAMLPEAPSADLEMKLFAMGTSLELAVLCRTGAFDKAVEKLLDLEAGLDRYQGELSAVRRTGLWFQAAWTCFGNGHFDKAAKWCHRVLNEPGIDALEETHAMARMLDLIIVLETDKRDLLPYALRNTERYLKGHARVFGTEKAIFRYVHDRMKAPQVAAQAAAARRLKEDLLTLRDDPMERPVFDHFDPLAWVESKLRACPLSDVVRDQLQRPSDPRPDGGGLEREAA